jgi:hypothetical protein
MQKGLASEDFLNGLMAKKLRSLLLLSFLFGLIEQEVHANIKGSFLRC